MTSPYPYLPGYIRRFFLSNPDVVEMLDGGRIVAGGSIPPALKSLHVRIAVVGQAGSTPRARTLLVQVVPWFPEDPTVTGADDDPVTVVWNAATLLGQVVAQARNEIIDEHTSWRAEWIEGPVELFDSKQGADRVLLYTPITLKVTVSHR